MLARGSGRQDLNDRRLHLLGYLVYKEPCATTHAIEHDVRPWSLWISPHPHHLFPATCHVHSTYLAENRQQSGGASLCLQLFGLLDSILESCTLVGLWGLAEAPSLWHIHGPFSDTLDSLLGGLLSYIFHESYLADHLTYVCHKPTSSHLLWNIWNEEPKSKTPKQCRSSRLSSWA